MNAERVKEIYEGWPLSQATHNERVNWLRTNLPGRIIAMESAQQSIHSIYVLEDLVDAMAEAVSNMPLPETVTLPEGLDYAVADQQFRQAIRRIPIRTITASNLTEAPEGIPADALFIQIITMQMVQAQELNHWFQISGLAEHYQKKGTALIPTEGELRMLFHLANLFEVAATSSVKPANQASPILYAP